MAWRGKGQSVSVLGQETTNSGLEGAPELAHDHAPGELAFYHILEDHLPRVDRPLWLHQHGLLKRYNIATSWPRAASVIVFANTSVF